MLDIDTGDADAGQILELLRLTPTERLIRHQQALELVEELRRAGQKLYGFDPRDYIETQRTQS
jgi:hypothetical protein